MTEATIKARIKELSSLERNADHAHLDIMLEIGQLVTALQKIRKYSARRSAESELARMLRGAGHLKAGDNYIRACWQYAHKLTARQRRYCRKYQLGTADAVALCNMEPKRIDEILSKIRDGKITMAYGKGGTYTYHIRTMQNPARAGKRRQFKPDGDKDHPVYIDPSIISIRAFNHGEIDTDAIEDGLAALYTRVGSDIIERCRQAAMRRVQDSLKMAASA